MVFHCWQEIHLNILEVILQRLFRKINLGSFPMKTFQVLIQRKVLGDIPDAAKKIWNFHPNHIRRYSFTALQTFFHQVLFQKIKNQDQMLIRPKIRRYSLGNIMAPLISYKYGQFSIGFQVGEGFDYHLKEVNIQQGQNCDNPSAIVCLYLDNIPLKVWHIVLNLQYNASSQYTNKFTASQSWHIYPHFYLNCSEAAI